MALTAGTFAQNFKGTNVSTRGTGTLSLRNESYELTEATMWLQPKGDAILTLRGRQTWRLVGKWTGASQSQVSIFLNQGDIPRLNVTGYVYLRNGNASGFQFSGTSEYGRTTATFKDAVGGGGGGGGELKETFRGRGVFTMRGDRTSLNSCTVEFRDNRFTISAKSDVANVNFTGTYTFNRFGNYELNLSRPTGYTGSGEATMGRGRVEKVTLTGRRGREVWEFSFDRR
ncbi:MAG: hypothetical protein HONBIEJF_02025 [Fimbriimonadaceae bacterium]|nr:hypothetical protein [Fimbriimonadaceae bacterium]